MAPTIEEVPMDEVILKKQAWQQLAPVPDEHPFGTCDADRVAYVPNRGLVAEKDGKRYLIPAIRWLAPVYLCEWANCLKRFKTHAGLCYHVNKVHVEYDNVKKWHGNAKVRCEWKKCWNQDLPINSRDRCRDHLRYHTNERPWECPFEQAPGVPCKCRFPTQNVMENHMILGNHVGEMDKPAKILSFEEVFGPEAELGEATGRKPVPYSSVKPLTLGTQPITIPTELRVNLLPGTHSYHSSPTEQAMAAKRLQDSRPIAQMLVNKHKHEEEQRRQALMLEEVAKVKAAQAAQQASLAAVHAKAQAANDRKKRIAEVEMEAQTVKRIKVVDKVETTLPKRKAAQVTTYNLEELEKQNIPIPKPVPVTKPTPPVRTVTPKNDGKFITPKPLQAAPGVPIVRPPPQEQVPIPPTLNAPPAKCITNVSEYLALVKRAEQQALLPSTLKVTIPQFASIIPRSTAATASVFSQMLEQTAVISSEKAQAQGIIVDKSGQPIIGKGRRTRGALFDRQTRHRGGRTKKEEPKGMTRAHVEQDWIRALESNMLQMSDKIRGTMRAFTDYRGKFQGFKAYLEDCDVDLKAYQDRRLELKDASDAVIANVYEKLGKDGDDLSVELHHLLAQCDVTITVMEKEIIDDLKILLAGERKIGGERWTKEEIEALVEENGEEMRTRSGVIGRKPQLTRDGSGSDMGDRTSVKASTPPDDESMSDAESVQRPTYMGGKPTRQTRPPPRDITPDVTEESVMDEDEEEYQSGSDMSFE